MAGLPGLGSKHLTMLVRTSAMGVMPSPEVVALEATVVDRREASTDVVVEGMP